MPFFNFLFNLIGLKSSGGTLKVKALPKIDNEPSACRALADELDGLGFFDFDEPYEKEDLKRELLEHLEAGYLSTKPLLNYKNAYTPDFTCARIYHTDPAIMLEKGVPLNYFAPVFKALGIEVHSHEEDTSKENRTCTVNGKAYSFYCWYEANPPDTWGFTFHGLLRIVNDLLATTDTEERLYGKYCDHASAVVFLKPAMLQACKDSGLEFAKFSIPQTEDELLADLKKDPKNQLQD